MKNWILANIPQNFDPYTQETLAVIQKMMGFEDYNMEDLKNDPAHFSREKTYEYTRRDENGNFIFRPDDMARLLLDNHIIS